MTFHEYAAKVTAAHNLKPDWRYGQTCFNVLHQLRPDLAEEIRGTDLDPFFMDNIAHFDQMCAFLDWVATRLEAA